MSNNKRDGYVAGIGCFFGFALLLIFAINNEWNTSGQILWAFSFISGGLSVACFWKPETFGVAVSKYFENLSKNGEKASGSHKKQVQKDGSSGVQVIGHNANINYINVNGQTIEKKGATMNVSEKQYETSSESKLNANVPKYELIQLPDADVTQVGLNNQILNKYYDEANLEAKKNFSDALFSDMNIHVNPLTNCLPKYRIYLYFYSKYADKRMMFTVDEHNKRVSLFPPIKLVKAEYERIVATNIPWRISPHWAEFVKKAYEQIKPLYLYRHLGYEIIVEPDKWSVFFDDATNGEKKQFEWDGKGLDKESIKRIS